MSTTAFVSIGGVRKGRQAVSHIIETVASGGCGSTGGEGKASCGSSDGRGDMPAEIWEKVKNHPCCSEEAHHRAGARYPPRGLSASGPAEPVPRRQLWSDPRFFIHHTKPSSERAQQHP